MTPLNNSVLSLFIFAVEFKFMSYPNDSTMKRRILFSVMCAAIAAGAFAQGQGQGLAGINEATSLMTSYFDPATKLYASLSGPYPAVCWHGRCSG